MFNSKAVSDARRKQMRKTNYAKAKEKKRKETETHNSQVEIKRKLARMEAVRNTKSKNRKKHKETDEIAR